MPETTHVRTSRLDLHFDDGVKSWINGIELLAYAVEAGPCSAELCCLFTQTGHNPQRSVLLHPGLRGIRELADSEMLAYDCSVRLNLKCIRSRLMVASGGSPVFREHSDPAQLTMVGGD